MFENCSGSGRLLTSFVLEHAVYILCGISTVLTTCSVLCIDTVYVAGGARETPVSARGAATG